MAETLPAPKHPGGRPALSEDTQLTQLQLQFVELVACSGMSLTECARQAGYSNPGTESFRLMRAPHVVKALRQRRLELVEGDLTGLALKTLRDTMSDLGAPRDARLKAAKIVLDLGQFSKNNPDNKDLGRKSMKDMTVEELRDLAAKLRADARDDARETDTPPEGTNVINAIAEPVTP